MIDTARVKQLTLFGILTLISYAVFEKYFNEQSSPVYKPFTKGYALSGVIIQSTDESGQIVTTVESPAVIHYADTEKTVIQEPHIKLHDTGGDWLFNSDVGEINPQQTEIYFPNQVVIDLDDKNSQAKSTQVITSELVVDVTKKTGQTPAVLTMNELGTTIKGLGAVVNFEQQEIEILSDLYAEFEN